MTQVRPVSQFYIKATEKLSIGWMTILTLIMRLWMAKIFWNSGLTKINDWNTAVLLFREEYHVPLIPPFLAALMAASVELTTPILLLLGLGTRLAVIPMLIMTAVIEFSYASHPEHQIWALFLMTLLCYGPGGLSLDALIKRKLQ